MPHDFEQFSGYILAGGKSLRMGRDKACIRFRGRTFAQIAFDTLEPICRNRIKFVLNPNQTGFVDSLPSQAKIIYDIFPERGPIGGIHAALNDCKTEFAIVSAVDFPFVTTDFFLKLIENLSDSSNAIMATDRTNRIQPTCAILRTKTNLVACESEIASHKSLSLQAYFQRNGAQTKFIADTETDFRNINTLVELAKILPNG